MISTILFYLFAILTCGSAVAVCVSGNVVRLATALLGTLAGVAGLYFLLHAEFLAAVQLVIYAGGTLILIVFGIMLTNRLAYQLYTPRRAERGLAVALGVVLLVTLVTGILSTHSPQGSEVHPPRSYPIHALGQALLGDFLIPFELASVILLVVMIGAAFLSKRRVRKERGQ